MPISTGLFSRRNPYRFLKTPRRLIASQAQAQAQARPSIKPLHVLFTEAIGHSKKTTTSDSELKNNLKEQDIKNLKEKTPGIPKRMSLFAAFGNNQPPTKPKEPVIVKELSPDMKPLDIAHSKKTTTSDSDEEPTESKSATELKNNLKQLEQDIKTLKEKTPGIPKRMSLFAAFMSKQPPTKPKENKKPPTKPKENKKPPTKPKENKQDPTNPKEPVTVKEFSPDMKMFAQHLFEKGYFKDANFSQLKEKFDLDWFTSSFAVRYIKFAAQRFAKDNQEIAKWLSGSALKQVATFGCSHTSSKAVFPAKRLRKFFEVPENTVCCKCTLQQTCKFRNQSVWNVNTNNLELVTVMKVITSYGLESVHPQLVVPDVVKKSVSQLLKEIVKLSPTT
ncbi:uncharacterized protein LOC106779463 [Vigna radiata var. radiata]|uniref:Uncharacterized protein LOC106779463 n=1 Tax=Vigna radiata var. radiata TaxID=3916 RepID=A0A1S3VXF1_VIGRR|nr:uncharacterized protein LOC106779463 [Vigna radiata var. radiata]